MEAIILAGGMGTRLQSVVSDLPKAMAPVAGQPFLYYVLQSLEAAGFDHIILAVGYKHEVIEAWLADYATTMRISIVVEEEPLGTGGATRLSLCQAEREEVFILNGDTWFAVDYKEMIACHQKLGAETTLALKEMKEFDRYGIVELDEEARIKAFREKQYCASGLINAGVYLINRRVLRDYPERFSLERDYFEKVVADGKLGGFPSDRYFIDIGIPEDYAQAQKDFADGKYNTL
ncbi:D-glycero-alpha-D-manno-heptose 1-phosphate guanylyltransferase [Parabacteroides sp. PFB2-12]|uniref:nucleotidyltransferase family protein n=1 Tax=unclassified Parabacteroides TaxID=2649774 RepID=UPI002475F14F|nr:MULTISPECIES: nucleotidyltransferase family protein [unclassified Parabacteroides]MDH6341531.1 D-glycero-alpha-D-manno-heptose 1-phosphate guanylyltransferase [Parabacteroides sp. PM6-13]MDH6389325.1 D-glycero-alpha-D-manno-heptose 1-phosphate guanylyltransferase [Parabacteroides sp. PFB2-12]